MKIGAFLFGYFAVGQFKCGMNGWLLHLSSLQLY